MRKVRIGNDINVRWEVKTDGQAVSLEGKALKLYVRSAYRKEEITTFTVEGCVVSFTYPASMQRMTGARAVILEDATEGAPRRTVCADQAFTLVAHSCEESDDDVEFEDFMVSLQSNVLIGKPGLSAYEVWLSEGKRKPQGRMPRMDATRQNRSVPAMKIHARPRSSHAIQRNWIGGPMKTYVQRTSPHV